MVVPHEDQWLCRRHHSGHKSQRRTHKHCCANVSSYGLARKRNAMTRYNFQSRLPRFDSFTSVSNRACSTSVAQQRHDLCHPRKGRNVRATDGGSEHFGEALNDLSSVEQVAQTELLSGSGNHIPHYFTTIRSFFGTAAETVLMKNPQAWT